MITLSINSGDKMSKYFFKAEEKYAKRSSNESFLLHSHDEYEIYMFLEGDSYCVVENKTYPLRPGDVLIFRKNEMHRVYHNKKTPYKRFILMVSPEFFEKHGCSEYEKIFKDKSFDESNKISAEIVKTGGIFDAVMRLKNYTDEYKNPDAPVAAGIVTEILYLIGKASSFDAPAKGSGLIKNVISYINMNIDKDISLEKLSGEFFVSKYHLCRSFKKSTGLTIRQYINQKRLALVNEYTSEGKSLTASAALAGFKDYSAFYRTYVKANDTNPKNIKADKDI